MAADGAETSTLPEAAPARRVRRARNLRRVILAALIGFLVLGASGVLGVRTSSVAAAGGGYELRVTYPKVSRPGLAIRWQVEVRKPGGFDGPVVVATSGTYLDMFDENGLDPDPSASTSTPEEVIWEFDPPPGDALLVTFDARVEPAVQWGRRGTTRVLVDDETAVRVSYRTWIAP